MDTTVTGRRHEKWSKQKSSTVTFLNLTFTCCTYWKWLCVRFSWEKKIKKFASHHIYTLVFLILSHLLIVTRKWRHVFSFDKFFVRTPCVSVMCVILYVRVHNDTHNYHYSTKIRAPKFCHVSRNITLLHITDIWMTWDKINRKHESICALNKSNVGHQHAISWQPHTVVFFWPDLLLCSSKTLPNKELPRFQNTLKMSGSFSN